MGKNVLVLYPGTKVRFRNPYTVWQQEGGRIFEVWPDYENPGKSIIGVHCPPTGPVREEYGVIADDLLPYD